MGIFRYFFVGLFFLFSISSALGQTKLNKGNVPDRANPFGNDSSEAKKSKGFDKLASIDMYIKYKKSVDTTIVDTTLTIQKTYRFNYLQKDNFGLMPFANIGQSYNSLTLNIASNTADPLFGARGRHFNYYEIQDMDYYEVPTPWTRLIYKTAFEQGQLLDAFFTVNLSNQFNFSIAYKGLRSLGNYQNALTSSGNFRVTSNFKSKSKRYRAYAHIVMQDLLNNENGGLTDDDVINFESGDEEYADRSVFDPNLESGENILVGKRFYLNHEYDIVKQVDSIKRNVLTLVNSISFEDKFYQFYQTDSATNDFFGDSFTNSINDKVTLENFKTSLGVNFNNNLLGDLTVGINYNNINYGYDSVVLFPSEVIPNRIKTDYFGLEASYNKTIGKFAVSGIGGLNLSEEFVGSFISGRAQVRLLDDINFQVGINISSRLPNYNYLLYQSDYVNYNWYNFDAFNNINTQQFNIGIQSDKWFNADLDISNIDNYTYFNLEPSSNNAVIIKPKQFTQPLQYLRLKIEKEFRFGNFALDNTIMYQNVISDEDVLNVPTLISRNTFYYSNQIFKKAMTLQTGITFNYFTKYNMNGYDQLLAEFYVQNDTEIGGFPRLDFFINAKVRQTRIFLKAEHFNSSFTGYNYFSAPNHPFRDFTVRFGLVWDFFL